MITAFILVGIIALGVLLMTIGNRKDVDWIWGIGFLATILPSILFIIHIMVFSYASYGYEQFFARRSAFESTLNNARISGNQYELAAIVSDVADWNTELASRKYDNSTYFFDQYIDDRIETLKPIK